MQNLTIKYVVKNGELVLQTPSDHVKIKAFAKSVPNGTEIEVYHSAILDPTEKTLGQLAKVHVLIKQLATDTGHTQAEIKMLIKDKANLFDFTKTEDSEKEYKSFADCSKSELSDAIQACIEIGNSVGSFMH